MTYEIEKKLELREQQEEIATKIEYEHSLSSLSSRILAARGFTPGKELEDYLVPTLKSGLPHPKKMKNLEEAVELVYEEAMETGVAIACDFDVDGLSGGSLLHAYLKECGVPSRVYVPDRFKEGYGLSERIIREAKGDGYNLLVTVDYGTTNIDELTLAREIDLKTVVIDHHHVRDVPPCDVFVNPQQDGCNFADGTLSAAGLVWFFVALLSKRMKKGDPKDYLDLACLGTICDMVPLQGANRIIARRGLECLSKTKRPGLIALKDVIGARSNLSCSHVSFGIGPRINAAGRMLSGEIVIEVLTTSEHKKAEKLVKKLHRLNKQRQEVEGDVKKSAFNRVEEILSETGALPEAIAVHDKEFHTGVIGIVAQRLVQRFYRPSAVIGYDSESGLYKGSVRSIKGVSVIDLLGKLDTYLLQYGGHEGAGGFSIAEENLEDFVSSFPKAAKELMEDVSLFQVVRADTESSLNELTTGIVRELKRFEPLGIGNPGPMILLKDLIVKDIKLLKNAHMKVFFTNGSKVVPGLLWNRTEHSKLVIGNKVTVAGRADLNTFFGNTELQLNIQAVE